MFSLLQKIHFSALLLPIDLSSSTLLTLRASPPESGEHLKWVATDRVWSFRCGLLRACVLISCNQDTPRNSEFLLIHLLSKELMLLAH